MADTILAVKHLKKYFQTPRGLLHAVDDVSLSIERGKPLGVVGESGCGKSTTGRCILRLIEPTSGEVTFDGRDVVRLSARELKALRKDMQIIFQDPYASLDPRKSVSQIISEPIIINKLLTDKKQIEDRVFQLMETVGLAERLVNTYPHELDGGRRQRIGIARALVLNPRFVVCDEPVSALDVSIQAQVLNLMLDIQEQMGLTYIFITHDLSVVKYISDDIMVMYLGQMVEKAPAEELFRHRYHPYTHALISAVPIPDIDHKRQRIQLKGELTAPINPRPGCRFAARCIHAAPECFAENPEIQEVSPGHFVRCRRVRELNGL